MVSSLCPSDYTVFSQWDKLPHTHTRDTHLSALGEKTRPRAHMPPHTHMYPPAHTARGNVQSGEEPRRWRCSLIGTLEINLHTLRVQGNDMKVNITLSPEYKRKMSQQRNAGVTDVLVR